MEETMQTIWFWLSSSSRRDRHTRAYNTGHNRVKGEVALAGGTGSPGPTTQDTIGLADQGLQHRTTIGLAHQGLQYRTQ